MAAKCPKCEFDNSADSKFCKECGTQLIPSEAGQNSKTMTLETPRAGLVRGTLFAGRYEIIEELGAGGMGRVYRAFDKKIEEEIALKLIRPDIAAEMHTVERFRNEIKTARKIRHANVCAMHDLHEEGQTLFITMEYVRGEDLRSAIRRMRAITIRMAVSVFRQVAEGLGEAHRLGIVHRDLKPSNIMIDTDGNAKIMDFGIARTLGGAGATAEGAIIGTPEYMSPEQVEGNPADMRADIYALGVILFEAVTGQAPFGGDTPLSIAYKHRHHLPPDPQALNPQIPAGLSRVILRCLEKEREARYQTTGELLADLALVEGALPIIERTSTGRMATKRKTTLSKKITFEFVPRKLLIPTAALLVMIIVGVALIKIFSKKETAPSLKDVHSIAVLPFSDLSPEKDQGAWCEGIAETLLNSLSGLKTLQVRGRHSSFLFSPQDDPREVGKKLNAEKLLLGSLQKAGNRLRVTVRLIDASDGTPLWSDKFDGEMEEIFEIQDKITSMAILKMNIVPSAEEKTAFSKRFTNNKDAYEVYLKGRQIHSQWVSDALIKAISYYLDSIEKDQNFVLPYISLAQCYAHLYMSFGFGRGEDAYKKSKEILTKAFSLDAEVGEAYAVLAELNNFFEHDLEAAESNYQRAFQLSPRSPAILESHQLYLHSRGRLKEAEPEVKLLIEIDPLTPQNYFYLGRLYYYLRQFSDSIDAYRKAFEIDPDHANTLFWVVFTYLGRRDFGKALETAERFAQRYPEYPETYSAARAFIEAQRGKREEAEKYREAAKDELGIPMWAGAFYAAVGEKAQALENLTRLYDENRASLAFCFLMHFFDKYRSEPEFVALLKNAGFEF